MLGQEELKERWPEIILYRCADRTCDEAQEALSRLAKEFGAHLDIRSVDNDLNLKSWAGWRTPVVYINGRQVTHYQINLKRWKEALAPGVEPASSVVTGEIVDIHCYMNAKSKGEEHKKCAEECIKAGQPIGLLTRSGDLYLLIEDRTCAGAYASLKELVAEEVGITGDIRERGGVRALIIRQVVAA